MTAPTTPAPVVTITPGPLEVALAWLQPGTLIHIAGRPGPEDPRASVVEIPGSGMGWGAYLACHFHPRNIRLGRHERHRDKFQQAARQLESGGRGGPVIYVIHEPADWHGNTVLKATRIRKEGEE